MRKVPVTLFESPRFLFTLFESLPKVMVGEAEPACEGSVSPVEPDALQMVGYLGILFKSLSKVYLKV